METMYLPPLQIALACKPRELYVPSLGVPGHCAQSLSSTATY